MGELAPKQLANLQKGIKLSYETSINGPKISATGKTVKKLNLILSFQFFNLNRKMGKSIIGKFLDTTANPKNKADQLTFFLNKKK